MPELNQVPDFDMYHTQLDRCYAIALNGDVSKEDRALAVTEHNRIARELVGLKIPQEHRHNFSRKFLVHTEHLAAAQVIPCDQASIEDFIALIDGIEGNA